MTFIEHVFGIDPDGGSGAIELVLFLLPLLGAMALAHWRGIGRRRVR